MPLLLKELDTSLGYIPPKLVQALDNDYKPHKNDSMSEKFPNCCEFHKVAFELIQKWFVKFPNFSIEENERYKSWFNKKIYEGLPLKIIKQVSYTEYFISKKIDDSDWYKEIIDYINYNIFCFGIPDFFSKWYVIFLKNYLLQIDKDISEDKKKKLVAYLNRTLNPQKNKIDKGDEPNFKMFQNTIQKWVDYFPFRLEQFSSIKLYFEQITPIFAKVEKFNPHTGSRRLNIITNDELLEFLLDLTKSLLKKINSTDFVNNGESIQKLNKYKLDLLVESHSLKQTKLLDDFSTEELGYVNILEKWFDNEKVFLDGISELVASDSSELPNTSQLKYPKTFKTSFSKFQMERLRLHLIENSYISEISNDDFIYLFQGKPIVLSMKRIECLMPNSWCHYLLKEMVFNGINFNMKQVNSCIIGRDGKKLKSNSGRGGYSEIDDILKEIRE